MKPYNRMILTVLMVATTATIGAQKPRAGVDMPVMKNKITVSNVLNEGRITWFACEEPVTDAATGLSTVKWQNTENRHVEGRDGQWAKSVIMTSRTSTGSFERDATFPYVKATSPLVPCGWELIEEDGETVLHCYMKMPADVVTNFWLASDETAIVDSETGVQYRARRSDPDNWGQYFRFRAMKDSIVDLRIYFPPLPPETSSVYIYGVPNWGLNGYSAIKISRPNMYRATISPYDAPPEFHKPRLVREARNYNKDNSDSWAEYTDAHLIRPLKHNTMALWRTADATYIAVAREQNWTREYFGEGPNDLLIDNNGKQYRLKEVQDYPNGSLFWVSGNTGDWIAFVKVYEPLDPNVRTINYIVPEGEPFKAWGANWSGTVESNLDVEQLRRNQRLFEYHPRVVVE